MIENDWKFELYGKHRYGYSIRKLGRLLKKNLWDVKFCPFCGSELVHITPIWCNYRPNDIDAYKVTCEWCDKTSHVEGPFY